MITSPLVSIIIPIYNGSNYCEEAICSALNQTYKNIEVIVINDGSNDDGLTRTICQKYSKKIFYYEKENEGVSSALNLGISKMKGEYFCWLSHDDTYTNNKIETQINYMLKRKYLVSYSDYSLYDIKKGKKIYIKLNPPKDVNFRYWLLISSNLHGCTVLCSITILKEFGGFDEKLLTTQDYDLWFKISCKYNFLYIPSCLVISKLHSAQNSNMYLDYNNDLDLLHRGMTKKLFDINYLSNQFDKKNKDLLYSFIYRKFKSSSNFLIKNILFKNKLDLFIFNFYIIIFNLKSFFINLLKILITSNSIKFIIKNYLKLNK